MGITITGPRSVGKTTISKFVAKKFGLEYISSDEIREKAFEKYGGLDKATKSGVIKKLITHGSYNLILEIYGKKEGFVFDLPGGAFGSKSLRLASKMVRGCAKRKSIVVGLSPCEDFKKSVDFLFVMEKERETFKEIGGKELFEKTGKSYKKFPKTFEENCNVIIHVLGKNKDEIVEDIVRLVTS